MIDRAAAAALMPEDVHGREPSPLVSPICVWCRHLTGERRCRAFQRIPDAIWNGRRTHRAAVDGDGGLRFLDVREGR